MQARKKLAGALIVVCAIALLSYRYWPQGSTETPARTDATKSTKGQSKATDSSGDKEQALVEQALQKLAQRGLYDTAARKSCLSFFLEEEGQDAIDIAVHELHDAAQNCPGDPAVAPIRARYRVAKQGAAIEIYEPAEAGFKLMTDCDVLEYQAYAIAEEIKDPAPGLNRITKNGRSYFHSAPHPSCKSTQAFLVQGDNFKPQHQYKDFTKILYTHPKTQELTSGWILTADMAATPD
ncbi:hypothetical protein ACO0LF_25065 [Undibacterium sp. Di27W]|uniref:hypothetical protein n=1 Tax=Undibacterium sp. Di27W TaxID=3413036 RepID=UPI003BF43FD5